jgi:pyruvate/2-oxoglutarate/acetoin dehydrogenase E1 component
VVFIGHAALFNSKREVIPRKEYVIPLGQADVKREGSDVTVVAYGGMIPKALAAAETLSKEGLNLEVVDLRTIVPLDIKTIVKSVKKTGRLIITHEAMERGGPAGEIAFRVTEALPNPMKTMKAPIRRLAGKNVAASRDGAELQQLFLPQAKDIVELVKEMV